MRFVVASLTTTGVPQLPVRAERSVPERSARQVPLSAMGLAVVLEVLVLLEAPAVAAGAPAAVAAAADSP